MAKKKPQTPQPPKEEWECPITSQLFDPDEPERLLDALRIATNHQRVIYGWMASLKARILSKVEFPKDKRKAFLKTESFTATVEKKAPEFDSKLLENVLLAYPELADGVVKPDGYKCYKRDYDRIIATKSNDAFFEEFKSALTGCLKEPTGAPSISVQEN